MMKPTDTRTPGAITRGRKFDQVRDGASAIFLRDGYAAASVDDIARSARVSKATLYSYFPDKSLMFREVLRATLASTFRDAPFQTAPAGEDMQRDLSVMLRDLAVWSLAEPRLSMLRVITAEATRFPDQARAYDQAMEDAVVQPLADSIDGWIAARALQPHDSLRSARQMVALINGQVQHPALLNRSAPDEAQIDAIARDAAAMFVASHGVRAA